MPPTTPGNGQAGLVLPPFILLALAGGMAWILSSLFDSSLRGGWFSLEGLGYLVGGGGYGLFAALFLWLDAYHARGLTGGAWASRRSMWGRMIATGVIALVGAVLLGGFIVGGLVGMGQRSSIDAQPLIVAIVIAVLLAVAMGAVANVRARWRTRVAAPALG